MSRRASLKRPLSSRALFALTSLWLALAGAIGAERAAAQEREDEAVSAEGEASASPFDRDWGVGVHAISTFGNYVGVGGGGRLRWEPFDKLGVEVFGDWQYIPSDPSGFRHDTTIGFNLYVPFHVAERVRLRPLFGFCTVFSFTHLENAGRSDDIFFGVHAGAGIEVALGRHVSWNLDLAAVLYLGHGRTYGGWLAHVSDSINAWLIGRATTGIMLHF